MPNTTNFNWSTPADTDLVKNGASAIRTLGSSIDTSFVDLKGGTTGQVLKKTSGTDLDVEWGTASSGLTLINTTSFSAVASQSINDVFSATYYNYLILIDASMSTSANITLRYRVSGSDNSTSNYNWQTFESSSTANSSERQTGQSSNTLTYRNGDRFTGQINLFNPFETTKTTYTNSFCMNQTNTPFYMMSSGVFSLTTSFTGFSLIASTGNITGSISVLGVAK